MFREASIWPALFVGLSKQLSVLSAIVLGPDNLSMHKQFFI